MQNNLLKKNFLAARLLMIAAVIITLIAMTPHQVNNQGASSFSNIKNGDDKIYKVISGKQITKLLKQSKGENIIMNIYPVKRSNNVDKNDFDLEIIYLKQGEIFLKTAEFNMKQFKQQAGWYISYLKQKNIPKEDIPYGYYLTLNSEKLQEMVGIGIALQPATNQLEHCFIMTSSSDYFKKQKKDSCPCDPISLPMPMTVQADTAIGRCPPCLQKTVLYSNEMQKIIDLKYK